jgi:hypothetical protein
VSGVVHDAIEAVSGVIISSLNAKDVIRSVCECWEAVVHSSDSHESRFPTDELVWTVSMGRLRDRWHGVREYPDLKKAKHLLRDLVGSENSTVHDDYSTVHTIPGIDYSTWTSVVIRRLVGLRLARTTEGKVCICNQSTQPGDIIAVLFGHDYPMLLRSSLEAARKHRVLSRCYMYGIMDAEVLLGPLPVNWEVKLSNTLRSGQPTRWMFSKDPFQSHYMHEHDPRLGLSPFPQHWERIDKEDEMRLSWEVINSDPQMLPDSLKARGVQIETIYLIGAART